MLGYGKVIFIVEVKNRDECTIRRRFKFRSRVTGPFDLGVCLKISVYVTVIVSARTRFEFRLVLVFAGRLCVTLTVRVTLEFKIKFTL